MKFVQHTSLSESTWGQLDLGDFAENKDLLKSVTHEYIVITAGGKGTPYGVIGLMPGSLISPETVLWFSMFKDVTPSRAQLRQGRKLLRGFFYKKAPMKFKAEIFVGDEVGARFAKFCGFTPIQNLDDRIIYERKV